ncbi:hypothetical protein C8R47DRAFT_419801 [Mycena vitilis]|nr:hypothetical protein C8R47DRAFT_419801 [Mycena vitilis]
MPPAPPTPQGLLGPFYFGVILGTFLYGILVLQAITYYQSFKHDKTWLRCFVGYLFFVETVSTGMSVAMIYEPLVAQFGTDKPMSLFPSLLPSQPFLEAAVFVPVQFFYAWRISVIMRNYWVPALICVTSLTSMVGAVWTGIIVSQVKVYEEKPKINQTALIWSCSAAGADVVITAALMLSLKLRKTGIKRTDDTINTIVRHAVQTGLVTVAFTLLDVVLFVAISNSTLNFVFDFGLPKLYSNALISTFNARGGASDGGGARPVNVLFSGGGGTGSQGNRHTMSAGHAHSHAGSGFGKGNVSFPQTQEVYIEREVYIEMDPSSPRREGDDVLGMGGMGGMGGKGGMGMGGHKHPYAGDAKGQAV